MNNITLLKRGFRGLIGLGLALNLAAEEVKTLRIGGWLPYWRMPQAMERVRSSGGEVRDAFLFVLQMDASGHPIPSDPAREAEWIGHAGELRHLKARVWLTMVNDVAVPGRRPLLKDPLRCHEILRSPSRRREHIQALLSQCARYGADGLDIDYENVLAEDREGFSSFIHDLAQALHAKGLLLSVTVQPKTRETRSIGTGAQDWKALGRSADRIQIMLYNLHNLRTGPGPVATLSWMEQVLGFALTQCEREKIVPALKVGGFAWGPHGREITFQDLHPSSVSPLEPQKRDPDGMTLVMTLSLGKAEHRAYFEDATSLKFKMDQLYRQGFYHFTFWSIGSEDPSLWTLLNN
nr:glycosyl hydrolase family 18 protein [uncultured Holophaga sp.]